MKEIKLFGNKAILKCRSTADHMALDKLTLGGKISTLQLFVITVYDALKSNKLLFFFDKYPIKKLLQLPPKEIFILSKDVVEMEGGDSTYLQFLLKEISKEDYNKWIAEKKKEIAE
jgi:hypothetical protein